MGRSSGAGSPVWFRCRMDRATVSGRHHPRGRDALGIELTGREKPYKRKRGSIRGVRSSQVTREYRCRDCGYVGWSNHIDLARRAGAGR